MPKTRDLSLKEENKLHNERYGMVRKSNELIQKFRADMNTPQFKLTMYLIAKAYTYEDTLDYTFDIKDFCRCCGIDDDNGNNYRRLKDEIKHLSDKSIWYNVYGDSDVEVLIRFINKVWIYKKSGKIKLRIDEDMKPYILRLKKSWEEQGIPYTQFSLLYTLPMKSRYSIRLYELLKSWETAGKHYWDIEELKQLLNCPEYANKNFKQKALDIAVKEINDLSDITVSCDLEREGRKFKYVHFTIKQKAVDARLEVDRAIFEQLNGQLSIDDLSN